MDAYCPCESLQWLPGDSRSGHNNDGELIGEQPACHAAIVICAAHRAGPTGLIQAMHAAMGGH